MKKILPKDDSRITFNLNPLTNMATPNKNRIPDLRFSLRTGSGGYLQKLYGFTVVFLAFISVNELWAKTIYLDSESGKDRASGLSEREAWKSLKKVAEAKLEEGDQVLLKRGSVFKGKLFLQNLKGKEGKPIVVDCYGKGELPWINAKGYVAGVQMMGCSFVEISNLKITNDGGEIEPSAQFKSYGVWVNSYNKTACEHIYLRGLQIENIFASRAEVSSKNGKTKSVNKGIGVEVLSGRSSMLSNVIIENCRISRTSYTGIRTNGRYLMTKEGKKSGKKDKVKHLRGVRILNNKLDKIGGPGIQPGFIKNLLVRGNVVTSSGSKVDQRMAGRGSGIWPFASEVVMIEHNKFSHARGVGDSCGIHIDFNCSDVVVQYNLSVDNEGGFIEILGNNHNCCYRYNVSVNDGSRVKGVNGAHQEGKVLWLSGYVGKNDRAGPFNSYIYNNTIYLKKGAKASISISPTTDGVLIANNIFHIPGKMKNVRGDQKWNKPKKGQKVTNVVYMNNLYVHNKMLPTNLGMKDSRPIIGLAEFKNAGGHKIEDYIPSNRGLIKNGGIKINQLKADRKGLYTGLEVKKDILGNPIKGLPDLGAIEIQDP